MPWRAVWPGALFFTLITGDRERHLPLLPRQRLRARRIGGTIGFILIALVWFYLVSLALMAGAVINSLRYELRATEPPTTADGLAIR